MAASPKSATSSKSGKDRLASEEIIDGEVSEPSKREAKREAKKEALLPPHTGTYLSTAAFMLAVLSLAGSGYLYLENQRLQQDITQLASQIPAAGAVAALDAETGKLANSQREATAQLGALSDQLAALQKRTDDQLLALTSQEDADRQQLLDQISALTARQNQLEADLQQGVGQASQVNGHLAGNLKSSDISQLILAQLHAHSQMGLDLSAWPARLSAHPAFEETDLSYGDTLADHILSAHGQLLGQGAVLIEEMSRSSEGAAVSGLSGLWQKLAGLVRLQSLEETPIASTELAGFYDAYQQAVLASDLKAATAIITSAKEALASSEELLIKETEDWLASAASRQAADQLIEDWYLAINTAKAADKKGQAEGRAEGRAE